jgi:hypothetical protein
MLWNIMGTDHEARIFIGMAIQDNNVVVKALWYKPEGHEFDTRWGDFGKFI